MVGAGWPRTVRNMCADATQVHNVPDTCLLYGPGIPLACCSDRRTGICRQIVGWYHGVNCVRLVKSLKEKIRVIHRPYGRYGMQLFNGFHSFGAMADDGHLMPLCC